MKITPAFRAGAASIGRLSLLAVALSAAAWGSGFFGTVVPIGGHASDIALDEGRGVLYIANYSANRIEVMNTSDRSIGTSINVPFPGSLALSRDGKYLVVTTYSNFQAATGQPSNIVTIIALDSNVRRTVSLSNPPLAVAFGADGLALVLTTTDFLLLDPASASAITLDTVAAIASKVLPVPAATFPPQILTASMGVSGNGQLIYGITDTIAFTYSVADHAVFPGTYTASPPLGPRLVSVNNDGSLFLAGWSVYTSRLGLFAYQFGTAGGALNIGSHVIDSVAGLIYAQVPSAQDNAASAPPTNNTLCFPNGVCVTLAIPPAPGTPPATAAAPPYLIVADAANLTIRQRLIIGENLAGRSILNAARTVMYSISDSGVTVFPVGELNAQPRVAPAQEDLVFLGTFCNRQTLTQDITIANPGGGSADFRLSVVDPSLAQAVTFSATSGVTPATVRVTINPAAFPNNGTTTVYVRIDSDSAINLQPATCPKPGGTSGYANGCFRLLINNREPDQRGTLVNVPGLLVDLLADPTRNRYYVLRQDTNQVLIFNGADNRQTGALSTGSTPMQMAITPDGKYMLVGHNDAQFIAVFDLDTLQPLDPIGMPSGHYPRSVAISGRTILAASRVAGPTNQISQIDFESRTATPLPSLGPFENSINQDTVLVASPHGAYIMAAMPDGNLLLYDSNANTFTVSRKDYPALSGAYAASDSGVFVIDNNVLNQSLSRVATLDKGQGGTSGFAFAGQTTVFRTTGPIVSGNAGAAAPSAPGLIQRLDLAKPATPLATRTIEAPVFPTATGGSTAANGTVISGGTSFIRSLATLPNGNLISLTQSGFTVLPVNFDATTAKPVITSVVNTITGDPKQLTAGGPISVLGTNLAQSTVSSSANPAPTVLGDSCVTVNGAVIPLFMVSPPRINGQLPLNVPAAGQLIVYTPGGVSDPFNLTTQTTAPVVIQTPSAPGSFDTVPAVYRTETGLLVTLTNPVHKGDQLTIFMSGLGPTTPPVPAGAQAPSNPPAQVINKPVVTLDGATCPVVSAILAPGQIGIYQVIVNVPKGINQGLFIPLTVSQGAISSTVLVRVVE